MVTIGRRWCVSSWALGAVLVGLSLAFVPAVSAQLMEPAATDEELAEAEARALFNAAVAAYDAGRYEDALESFERAYRRSNRAALLYNMGQCYDRLRRDEEAVNAFERYLEAMPAAENRAQVESRIRALREAIARRANPELAPTAVAAASEPAVAAPGADLREERSHRPRRIALITTSVVVVAAAVVLTVLLAGGGGSGYASSDVGTVFALQEAGR